MEPLGQMARRVSETLRRARIGCIHLCSSFLGKDTTRKARNKKNMMIPPDDIFSSLDLSGWFIRVPCTRLRKRRFLKCSQSRSEVKDFCPILSSHSNPILSRFARSASSSSARTSARSCTATAASVRGDLVVRTVAGRGMDLSRLSRPP